MPGLYIRATARVGPTNMNKEEIEGARIMRNLIESADTAFWWKDRLIEFLMVLVLIMGVYIYHTL